MAYLKNTAAFLYLDLMGMLFDNYEDEIGIVRNRFDEWIDENKENFYKETGLKEEDFFFANKEKLDPIFYQSALYDTIIETKQAIEALYHQSKYASVKIWKFSYHLLLSTMVHVPNQKEEW